MSAASRSTSARARACPPRAGRSIADNGDGTYNIDSFFDVFVELSVDGGAFQPQTNEASRMDLQRVTPTVILGDPSLPPEPNPVDCDQIVSGYAGIGVHSLFPNGIDFSDPLHACFENVSTSVDPATGDETESFDSTVEATIDDGSGPQQVVLTGPVEVVTRAKGASQTGTFQTEILSMSLSGDVGGVSIEIRESPVKQSSPGQVRVLDIGGGQYQIDSFFDVFTELSSRWRGPSSRRPTKRPGWS